MMGDYLNRQSQRDTPGQRRAIAPRRAPVLHASDRWKTTARRQAVRSGRAMTHVRIALQDLLAKEPLEQAGLTSASWQQPSNDFRL